MGENASSGGGDVGGFDWGGGSSADGYGGGGGGAPQPPGRFTYEALCGIDRCVPGDLTRACTPEEGGGPTGVGGAGGESEGGGAAEGGAGGEGGVPGAGGSGGAELANACQIADRGGSPVTTCGTAGTGIIAGPCKSSDDCLPGLGCVLQNTGEMNEGGGPVAPPLGICRPYCCGDLEACPADTFCAPVPMFDESLAQEDPLAALPIPVCTPLDPCQLLGDDDKDCVEGETCSVVRASGATSCVPIGEGTLCQPCPCAEGHVCNFGTGLCLKLCDTTASECMGEGAVCQGGGNLPDPVGVCIGGDAVCKEF